MNLGFFPWLGFYILLPLAALIIAIVALISLTERWRKLRGPRRKETSRISGKVLIIGMGLFLVVFGAALWWSQTQVWYDRVSGVDTVLAGGRTIPVTGYDGLDGNSPLKLRGCFHVDPDAFEGIEKATDAAPLGTPGWFSCYDEERLTEDIASGRATAYLAGRDDPKDFERIIAVYPDGRAYLWRQLNEKYRD